MWSGEKEVKTAKLSRRREVKKKNDEKHMYLSFTIILRKDIINT
jgi:hypothetical protein